jgi:hypothetical protein
MSFLPADSLNCEIIALSLGLQREISRNDGPEGPEIGAQQVMPKPGHVADFSPKNPLPWVPDRVGADFSRENNGVLVVGSSYNGFIEGYSSRSMALADYLAIRDLIREGNEDPANPKVAEACAKFVQDFEAQVMEPDRATYYGPIFDDLLRDVPASRVCLTDLCKASYVQRNEMGNRQRRNDYGGDNLICDHLADWARYLTAGGVDGQTMPLPYEWLWRRIQNSCFIIPLGVLAEYGVRKVFNAMLPGATLESRLRPQIVQRSQLESRPFDWENPYSQDRVPATRWHAKNDWLVLSDGTIARQWYMLPVYHPNYRTRSTDPDYSRSRAVLGEMQNVWTALSRFTL